MEKRLLKIQMVWQDLEKAYKHYSGTHAGISRKQYLKKLLAFDNSGANITGIRNLLQDELSSYSVDEMSAYSVLFSNISIIAQKLESFSEEIENLNTFVNDTLGNYVSTDNQTVKEIPSIDIQDFQLLARPKATTARDNFDKGIFKNSVILAGDDIKAFTFNPDDKFYKYFSTKKDCARFLSAYSEGKIERCKFYDRIVKIFYQRLSDSMPLEHLAIVSGELYSKNKRTVVIGNTKIVIKNSNHLEKTFSIKNKSGTSKKVSVDYYDIAMTTLAGDIEFILMGNADEC